MAVTAGEIVDLIRALEKISDEEHRAIRAALDEVWRRSAEADLEQQVCGIGFPWRRQPNGTLETEIGLLGECRVECEPVGGERWVYRVYMPNGSLMLENRGPGGEGLPFDAVERLVARLNQALQL